MHVTEAGRVVLASCEMVLACLERTIDEVEMLRTSQSGSVALGSGPYFASYLLPLISASFQRLFPGVRVNVQTARALECLEAIRRGRVELAIVGGEVSANNLERAYLAGKDLIWIARAEHRLASRCDVLLAELAKEDLLLPPRTSSSRRALEKLANEQGVDLNPTVEVGGVEGQVTAVLNGLGVAAVPSHVLSRFPDAPLRVLSVVGFPVHASWSLVWRKEELSPAAIALRDYLLSQRAQIEATSLYSAIGGMAVA
jgi:DNA-binding transcriptional LysR family regulator